MSVSGIGGANGAPKPAAAVHHPKVHAPKVGAAKAAVSAPVATPAAGNTVNKKA